jgi:hypothetical protein
MAWVALPLPGSQAIIFGLFLPYSILCAEADQELKRVEGWGPDISKLSQQN